MIRLLFGFSLLLLAACTQPKDSTDVSSSSSVVLSRASHTFATDISGHRLDLSIDSLNRYVTIRWLSDTATLSKISSGDTQVYHSTLYQLMMYQSRVVLSSRGRLVFDGWLYPEFPEVDWAQFQSELLSGNYISLESDAEGNVRLERIDHSGLRAKAPGVEYIEQALAKCDKCTVDLVVDSY